MAKLSVNCKALTALYLNLNLNSQKRGFFKVVTGILVHKPVGLHKLQLYAPTIYSTGLVRNCGCLIQTSSINHHLSRLPATTVRHYVTSGDEGKPEPKPSLYQRFKTMYRDYWYVLLPVHFVTSAGWFGGFYYMATSGVDIVALLESMNVSDKLINPLRNGHATTGYLAISYALYKIATPLRYTVTLGGATLSINYLKKWGYIKPVPSKEQLKEIYDHKKEVFREKRQSFKDNVMQTFKTEANTVTTKESSQHY